MLSCDFGMLWLPADFSILLPRARINCHIVHSQEIEHVCIHTA